MKKHFHLFTLCILSYAFILSSCKTKDTVEDIVSGNGDYIEFKLDGTTYRIESSAVNSTDYVQSVTSFQSDTIFNTYSFSSSLSHIKNLAGINPPSALFRITMGSPLTTGNYFLPPFDLSNPTDTLISFSYLKSDSSSYDFTTGPTNSGSIQISKLNSTSGGETQGTFNFNNLDYLDKDGNVISSGHTLTGGKFKSSVL